MQFVGRDLMRKSSQWGERNAHSAIEGRCSWVKVKIIWLFKGFLATDIRIGGRGFHSLVL